MSVEDNRPVPVVPKGWRIVFGLEIPLSGGSVLYWLVDPSGYLREIFGITSVDTAHLGLLQQLAGVVFSVFVYFYARFLLSRRPLLPTFALLQEAFTVSDLLLAWVTWQGTGGHERTATQWAAIVMPLVWALIRVVFLGRTRGLNRDQAGEGPARASPRGT